MKEHAEKCVITRESNMPVHNQGGACDCDGYHTFEELYEHRIALFIALMKQMPDKSWRANNHDDGTNLEGWFIAGIHLSTGDISYHLPNGMWQALDNLGIKTTNKAPKWDGHTAQDVINRLTGL